MLEAVSLDHLRMFIAAAEEGSFSAAGRRLYRAQSVVSQTIANLEAQIGVLLFDRSGRYPRLTERGRALLTTARRAVDAMDGFKLQAQTIAEGLEPELSVVVDVMYPMASLTAAVDEFRVNFPHTPLRIYAEALGGVMQLVLDGTCRVGVGTELPGLPFPGVLGSEAVCHVRLVPVAAPTHPLARLRRPLRGADLQDPVQLVLTDRSRLTEGKTFGVLSPSTWRLTDLGAKHAFLRAGLGWGHMPYDMVRADLEASLLVELQLEHYRGTRAEIPIFATYRNDAPPGPAGRWLLEHLKQAAEPAN